MTVLSYLVPENKERLANLGRGRETAKHWLLAFGAFLSPLSENTRKAYSHSMREFFDTFDWLPPSEVKTAHAAGFKAKLLARGLSGATVSLRLSALSSFFRFLCQPQDASGEPYLRGNPFAIVSRRDIAPDPYGTAQSLPWEVFSGILDAMPNDKLAKRDRALLLFYAFTGRRRNEPRTLKVEDLDLREKKYRVTTKGGKIQTYVLPDIVREAIGIYWKAYDRKPRLAEYVFTASEDGLLPLSTVRCHEILKERAADAGVDAQTVHLHMLRHMSARDLERGGASVREIQGFLGHASLHTTAVYLDKLTGTLPAHEDVLTRVRAALQRAPRIRSARA